jgi:hypothetical protein
MGRRELSYEERAYDCLVCSTSGIGYHVVQKSPPAFFLQPHNLYPMSVGEFAHWLSVFQTHFPTDERLGALGVSWYPGKVLRVHEGRLRRACEIGQLNDYYLSLSNVGPDDTRIQVCVQRDDGEANFWIDPSVELEFCRSGFNEDELEVIRKLLLEVEPEVRAAWKRFWQYATETRMKWFAKLEAAKAV